MVVDTTFWIDLLDEKRRGVKGHAHTFMARHRAQRLHISIVAWGELAEAFTDYDALDYFLRNLNILPLPLHVAWTAAQMQRTLNRAGYRLGENDAWIAGTALAWGKKLVTRDAAFSRVPRLKVLRYDQPDDEA